MGVIEEYTFLKSEREVLAELDKIGTPTGTRIVLFNLKAGEHANRSRHAYTCFYVPFTRTARSFTRRFVTFKTAAA